MFELDRSTNKQTNMIIYYMVNPSLAHNSQFWLIIPRSAHLLIFSALPHSPQEQHWYIKLVHSKSILPEWKVQIQTGFLWLLKCLHLSTSRFHVSNAGI